METLATMTCEWCGKKFTHPDIHLGDIEKYKNGGGVVCPYCWRFTNPNPVYHNKEVGKNE